MDAEKPEQSRHSKNDSQTMKTFSHFNKLALLAVFFWIAGMQLVQGQNCTNLTDVIPCTGLILGQEESGSIGTFSSTVEWSSLGKAPFPLPSGDRPYGLRVQRGNIGALLQVQERTSTQLDAGIRFGEVATSNGQALGQTRLDFDYFQQNQSAVPPSIAITNIMSLVPANSKLFGQIGQICITPEPCFGRVGIENTNPTYTLDVNGTIRATGQLTTSDRRFKQNIQPVSNGLAVVRQLRGTTYAFKTDAEFENLDLFDGIKAGFIAQEVEAVLPHLVSTDEQGYKAVNYIGVLPYLVEAVKDLGEDRKALVEQAQEIATLEKELADLKREMLELAKQQVSNDK